MLPSAPECSERRCSEVLVKTTPLTCLHVFSSFLQALLGPLGTPGPKGLGLATSVASSWFSTVRRTESPPVPRACPGSGRATVSYTWKDRRRHTIRTSVCVRRVVAHVCRLGYSLWVKFTDSPTSPGIPPLPWKRRLTPREFCETRSCGALILATVVVLRLLIFKNDPSSAG